MSLTPVLATVALWFLGTAAVVWLVSRPPATFAGSIRLSALAAIGALIAIPFLAADPGPRAAYAGFGAAILIWGWHEVSFLTGHVAGPRRAPLPPGIEGWARFRLATATVIHHELALAATMLLMVALNWGGPNQAPAAAFAVLFAMRLSAKLNLFLGVPNLSDEVFPKHLDYLKSYFRHRAMNPLFPFSLLLAGGLGAWGWQLAEAAPDGSGAAITGHMVATLAGLAALEHVFLILPLRDAALWRWASASRTPMID